MPPILQQRQIIHNRWVNQSTEPITYDYIVVGGGTAGCAVACRLAARPENKVLLVEAGGAQHALFNDMPGAYAYNLRMNNEQFWPYTSEPQPEMNYRSLKEVHGKVLGGDSTVNAMVYGHGSPVYYDSIQKHTGARGWSYAEVLPYFRKAENYTDPSVHNNKYLNPKNPIRLTQPHSTPPILYKYMEAVREMGTVSLDSDVYSGPLATIGPGMFADGVRSSSANGYIEFGRLCPKLHVQANTVATKVLIAGGSDRQSPRAYGVQVFKNGTLSTVNCSREIIISAGGYGSPHLLMLSGIGPRKHLVQHNIRPIWADLPVGSSYQNRPAISLLYEINNVSLIGHTPNLTDQQIDECLTNGKGPMCDAPRLYITVNSKLNKQINYTDIIYFGNVVPDSTNSTKIVGKTFTFLTRCQSKGTVRLRSSNWRDLPVIQPNLLRHPRDRLRLLDAIAQFYYTVEKTSFKNYASVPVKPQNSKCSYCRHLPVWKCTKYHKCLIRTDATTEYHPLGAVPFGAANRPDSVLDERLRVKGIHGLRVADTSVMPVGNTYTPNTGPASVAFMVAEKAADMILQDNVGLKL
ncbi:uncharacterized GMC-type oxidoreductase Mb1310-like [Oppia nitens]|uniref:uncharacterized GMC-type oxidoreductase Mb1310-like n=1 Tax=Oppia nitens TaxID=1686743 RepID=UPI0023DB4153|nr:uncharacterized GMC-type oxidoreductase Mb1310-like [Oppia nitens]